MSFHKVGRTSRTGLLLIFPPFGLFPFGFVRRVQMPDTCGFRVPFFHDLDVGELRMNPTQIGKSSRTT